MGSKLLGLLSVMVLAALLGFAGCVAVGSGCGMAAAKTETRNVSADHVAGSALRVLTANGSVQLTAAPIDHVAIVAHLRAETDERLAAVTIVTQRQADGTLLIMPQWPNDVRRPNEGCAFEIQLPDAQGVQVRASNGSVEVTGLGGDAVLETSNGRIRAAQHRGSVQARTSNGGISILQPGGDVNAQTSNGAIHVEDAPAAVRVATSNGPVSVRLTDACPGPVAIDSSNGRVEFEVGRGFAGELNLATSNGGVNVRNLAGVTVVAMNQNSGRLRFGASGDAGASASGSGGGSSRIRTSNGPIEVRLAEGGGITQ